jgi:enoyl-CoA hydratase/carnithine racemase
MSAPDLAPDRLAVAGVALSLEGPLATVTLCRPERRNAQTPATWAALADIGRGLPGDVRVVVLRAEGVSFSAGLDRAMFTPEGLPGFPSVFAMATMPEAEADAVIAGYQEGFTWWRRPDIVSIAAVQGHAVGAGFQLALACDLRVAADDVSVRIPEVTLGIPLTWGGVPRLAREVGLPVARDLVLTGRTLDGAEALQCGFVQRLVPATGLDAAVEEVVTALLAQPVGALAVARASLAAVARDSPGVAGAWADADLLAWSLRESGPPGSGPSG